jgi:hypothetical protein
MLVINPEKRIGALDALMHDFCIVNKKNYIDQKRKKSTFVPCADDFISQYSMDKKGSNNSQSMLASSGSFMLTDRLSFMMRNDSCIEENDDNMIKRNSSSTNEVSSLGLPPKQDALILQTFSVESSHENTIENVVVFNPTSTKKSKFAN